MGKYEDALERARAGKPIDEVFPELKESEDERIRTRLIALVEAFGQGKYKDEMLAYLEKQKEVDYLETKISFPAAYSVVSDAGYVIISEKEYKEYLEGIRIFAYSEGVVDTEKKYKKEPRDYRKLYEEVVKSDWFKENYVGKSLGEGHQPAEWSEEDETLMDELESYILFDKEFSEEQKKMET